MNGEVEPGTLLGSLLELFSHLFDFLFIVLGLLELLLNLSRRLFGLIQSLDEAIRLKYFLARIAKCVQNPVKDLSFLLLHLQGLLRVSLSVFFFPR